MALPEIISQVLPQTIYRTTSPISGEIKVVEQGPERRLMVSGVCQSVNTGAPRVEQRYWGQAAKEVKRVKSKVQNCLVLGLGGGTVVHFLARDFPGVKIDVVELDPEIVAVAHRFFDLDQIPNLRAITADAAAVVANPARYEIQNTKYDLVLVDLYLGSKFSAVFGRVEFIRGIADLLAPAGLAVFNRVFQQAHPEALQGFTATIGQVFAKVEGVVVPGPYHFANLLTLGWNNQDEP